MDTNIYRVIEIYTDEEKTLQQGITYLYGDERDAAYARSQVNPHLTKLVVTRYLNKEGEIISVERAEEE